ncbi:MAG: T9SS type A sorting domain-containing protein [Bacteroidota bacterium]
MKHLKYILFAVMIFCSLGAFAQSSTGELERFKNESLVQANDVQLFPNPSVDYLTVRIENFDLKEVNLVVYNIIGNVVEVTSEEVGEGEFRVKVEDLTPGYYLISIRDDQFFQETYKFLKR